MLRRKAYDELMGWRSREHRMCLLVEGRRGCGKTFVIDRFARDNYAHYVYMDLSRDETMRKAFSGSLDVDTIVNCIGVHIGFEDLVPGETLIFIDGIQGCIRARESLKSFSIDGRFDVIAAGTPVGEIRGLEDGRLPVLPVGYEEHLRMTSMDFEEFLWARGLTEDAIGAIRDAIRERRPLGPAVMEALDSHFRDFMIVGGMPEAVARFVEDGTYAVADDALSDMIGTDRMDIAKHTGANGPKIARCFDSIPSQLSGSNKRFMFSRIDGDGSRNSARKYAGSLLWVERSGIGNLCYGLRSLEMPLEAHREMDVFRVYMSDTGMLLSMMGRRARAAVYDRDDRFNMGALTENVVAECLMKSGHRIYYRRVNGGRDMMELDFVIELGLELAVIEVKSGKDRSAPSIRKTLRYPQVERRIMFERGDIRVDDEGIEHYPLFAAAFTDAMETEWSRPGFRAPHIGA